MRIPRFYIADDLSIGQVLDLPQNIHRHAVQVLRLQPSESLILFNGAGGEYYCEIETAEKRCSSVKIIRFDEVNRESNLNCTLVQSLIKPEKMDFCIQKSVELGVSAIQPIMTERSVVRLKTKQIEKKLARWQQIIISACEQSGRTQIPTIHAPIPFLQWLEQDSVTQRMIMSPESSEHFSDITLTNDIEFVIGPEGGFTEHEIQQCQKTNIQEVNFGSRILRAETAAIASLTLLQSYSGNL